MFIIIKYDYRNKFFSIYFLFSIFKLYFIIFLQFFYNIFYNFFNFISLIFIFDYCFYSLHILFVFSLFFFSLKTLCSIFYSPHLSFFPLNKNYPFCQTTSIFTFFLPFFSIFSNLIPCFYLLISFDFIKLDPYTLRS